LILSEISLSRKRLGVSLAMLYALLGKYVILSKRLGVSLAMLYALLGRYWHHVRPCPKAIFECKLHCNADQGFATISVQPVMSLNICMFIRYVRQVRSPGRRVQKC
jgi:hypothetical protein